MRIKLSQASLLLLHLVEAGHVWRDKDGFWVASTERNKRNVHLRIVNMAARGLVLTRYNRQFPEVTEDGRQLLRQHPIPDLLQHKIR